MNFLDLVKNTKKNFSSFIEFRMAILADSSTQFLVQALKGVGFVYEIRLEFFDRDAHLGFQKISDPTSKLYEFKPSLVFHYSAYETLKDRFWATDLLFRDRFAESLLAETKQTISIAKANGLTSFLVNTVPIKTDAVFGQLGAQIPVSFQHQIRKYNYLLTDWMAEEKGIKLLDLQAICSEIGWNTFFDPKLYYSSQAEIGFAGLPHVANKILQQISAQLGRTKKCIVLDLDNTLWGGVVGDDGWENLEIGSLGKGKVFSEIQKWLLELKRRGILLCVCSKNEEQTALEVFEKHPEMILRREDIACFVANWNPKNENVLHILQQLNIGADSLVYLDDNPAERDLITTSFPEITVPELPQDPSLWLAFLESVGLFEIDALSETDTERTQLYQEEEKRRQSFDSLDLTSYLVSLDMSATIQELNTFTLPRIAQLTQRTNQFNLRTQRYSEEHLLRLTQFEGYICRAFSLKDKFGDLGLVSVILLKPENDFLFIDTWIMSCRVFGRGLEYLVWEELKNVALKEGKILTAEYIPTPKNKPVAALLPDLGFEISNGIWSLHPKEGKVFPHYIRLENNKTNQ